MVANSSKFISNFVLSVVVPQLGDSRLFNGYRGAFSVPLSDLQVVPENVQIFVSCFAAVHRSGRDTFWTAEKFYNSVTEI